MCSIIKRKKLTENITNVRLKSFLSIYSDGAMCVFVCFFPLLTPVLLVATSFFLPHSYEGEFGVERAITIAWLKNKNNDLISFHLELLVLFRSFLY